MTTVVATGLLIVLVCVAVTSNDLESIYHRCCSLGVKKSLDPLKCDAQVRAPIAEVPIEQQSVCSAVTDICCVQFLRDVSCKRGINAAKKNEDCVVQVKTDEEYKYCCDACKLGIVASSKSESCQFKNFRFSSPWNEVYASCCTGSVSVAAPSTVIYETNQTKQNNIAIICSVGYRYDLAKNDCVDVDECAEKLDTCKSQIEVCTNHVGGYRCLPILNETNKIKQRKRCEPGFQFNPHVSNCVDVNECEDKPCDSNELCENTPGSYKCSCNVGFQRDTTGACVDINECQIKLHNCDQEFQRCDNTIGSFHCIRVFGCGTGYTLNSETNTCDDNDECALGTDNCKRIGSDYECVNMVGTFRCVKSRCPNCTKSIKLECPKGFRDVKGSCTDINECEIGSICAVGQNCVNTVGSYKCELSPSVMTCENGFRFSHTLKRCIDIDECSEQLNSCGHKCVNTRGSFECSCEIGYLLHQDNRSCVDTDECKMFPDRRLCMFTCVNEPGTYKCECPTGYKLGVDKASCLDIDECTTENRCSSPNEICLNTRGSFRCYPITCPANYTKNDNRKNRCERSPNFCTYVSQECLKMPLSYSFNFLTFVSNLLIPTTGQLDLFHMRAPSNALTVKHTLELNRVEAPRGIAKVTTDFFKLIQISPKVVNLALVKKITGPQNIELDLRMDFFDNDTAVGFTIFKLFIDVSQYEF